MPYDFEVMGDPQGGTIPEDLVRSVLTPTLVLVGSASPEFFMDTALQMADLLPNGSNLVLDGQDHGAPPEAVAPVVADYLGPPAARAG